MAASSGLSIVGKKINSSQQRQAQEFGLMMTQGYQLDP